MSMILLFFFLAFIETSFFIIEVVNRAKVSLREGQEKKWEQVLGQSIITAAGIRGGSLLRAFFFCLRVAGL